LLLNSYYVSGTIKSKDGTLIRRSVDYWFTIEPNREKLKSIKERVGESIAAMARVSNPAATTLKAGAEKILVDIQQLENNADTEWKSSKWNDLTLKIGNKEIEVAQLLHKVKWSSMHNWSSNSDFGIALTHSVIKLRKDAISFTHY